MQINALNTLKAKSLPAGKWSDGQGLWLVKRSKTRGKWVLRFSVSGNRREMGLGSWPDTGLPHRGVPSHLLVSAYDWQLMPPHIQGKAIHSILARWLSAQAAYSQGTNADGTYCSVVATIR